MSDLFKIHSRIYIFEIVLREIRKYFALVCSVGF